MISQKSVQEVIEKARIEDVVEDYVTLKRRGVNMLGLCPFHNEKTPSFTVSPAKNIYKCFGCGKAGNPVQFVMEHESFSFPEALRFLAKKYNIELEETVSSQESIEERQHFDSLYLINQFAKESFQENLFETPEGKSIGLSYFKERGFREETIKKFGLGYTLNKRDAFTLKAIQKGYNIQLLKELGLTSKYDKDFFRSRVMFSIHNLTGKVLGFGGRILDNTIKAPKYVNSPETEIYNKSKILYGAYFAKGAIRKEEECIMVEGYTDVLALHQAGIENVVSSSGTSLTVDQIRLVKRFTPNMKILYDGDQAGVKAALRGLDLVLEQDMNVKVVLLPDGEDPDSYLNKVGASKFKTYLTENADDFIFFKTKLLMEEAKGDPIKKTKMIKDIVSSIARIPDPIKRSLYIKQCAATVDVSEQILVTESNKVVGQNIRKREQRNQRNNTYPRPTSGTSTPSTGSGEFPTQEPNIPTDSEEYPTEAASPAQKQTTDPTAFKEKDIIRILISSGGMPFDQEEDMTVCAYVIQNIEEIIDDFDNKLYENIAKECRSLLQEGKQFDQQYFINHSDPAIGQLAIELIHSPFEYSPNWQEKWEITLQTQKAPEDNFTKDSIQSLYRFKLDKLIKMCTKNQTRIQEASKTGDADQVMLYLKVQQKLLQMRNELAKKLNTVIFK